MPTSAPSVRARSSLASLDDVTMTRAPQSLAICTAVEDTPPPTPMISTSWPARSWPCVTTIRHAVMLVRMKEAASSNEIDAGRGRTLSPRTATSSARPPGRVLAQDAVAHAEAVLALGAELAAAAREVGIDRHPVADLDAGHLRADLGDLARDVAARPERQRRLERGDALADEEVEMVQGAGAHPHQHLAGLDLGVGDVLQLELVGTAELVERERLHAGGLLLSVEFLHEPRQARIVEGRLLAGLVERRAIEQPGVALPELAADVVVASR